MSYRDWGSSGLVKLESTISGTDLVFKKTGGDAAITLASVATTKARQSVKLDLGEVRAQSYYVFVEIETGAAPTADDTIGFYWSASPNATAGSQNAGGASGADAAYRDGAEAVGVKQLDLIGTLTVTAEANTVLRAFVGILTPGLRYGSLIVWNGSDQSLEANDDEHRITFTPVVTRIE